MKKEYYGSTIGMMARHQNMNKTGIVRVEFYRTNKGVELHAISGKNLERIRNIKTVTISIDEFNDRPNLQTENCNEFFWATKKLGFELPEEEFAL